MGEDVQDLINGANDDEWKDLQTEIQKLVEARNENPENFMSEFDWRGQKIMLWVRSKPNPTGSYNFMICGKQFFKEIRKLIDQDFTIHDSN